MGSSLSAIADDLDDYQKICDALNVSTRSSMYEHLESINDALGTHNNRSIFLKLTELGLINADKVHLDYAERRAIIGALKSKENFFTKMMAELDTSVEQDKILYDSMKDAVKRNNLIRKKL